MILKQVRVGLITAVVMGMLFLGGQAFAATEITKDLKSTIDEVISIVSDESLKDQQEKRRDKIRSAIEKRFNYQQMVMRSLAKAWNDRTPEERTEFIALFKKLLENSYASKIESYSDEKINYIDEVVKGKYALVKTEIVRKDSTIGVDYKLIKDNGQWLVYDFIVEGVSMIRNYRSQFSKIIRKKSYKALVEKLTTKISEIESSNGDAVSENL